MATREAIALMRDNALHRLLEAADAISAARAIAPPDMPERNRDPEYQHAAELRAVADWAKTVAQGLTRTHELEPSTEGSIHVSTTKNARSGH